MTSALCQDDTEAGALHEMYQMNDGAASVGIASYESECRSGSLRIMVGCMSHEYARPGGAHPRGLWCMKLHPFITGPKGNSHCINSICNVCNCRRVGVKGSLVLWTSKSMHETGTLQRHILSVQVRATFTTWHKGRKTMLGSRMHRTCTCGR